ncbi:MAG: tetratricopeptide repeat protein [Candidatus Kariarchaeaceae archaeon]
MISFQEHILKAEEELFRGNLEVAMAILKKLEDRTTEEKLIINITKSRIILGRRDYQKAESLAKSNLQDSITNGNPMFEVDALIFLIKVFISVGDAKDVKRIITQAESKLLEIALKPEIKKRELELLYQKASYYDLKGELDKALTIFMDYSEKLDDFSSSEKTIQSIRTCYKKAQVANMIGIINQQKDNPEKAIHHVTKALKLFEEINNKNRIAAARNNLAIFLDMKGEVNAALRHYHDNLEMAREEDDKQIMGVTLKNIGGIHISRGEIDKALTCLEESARIKKILGNQESIAFTESDLALLYHKKGELDISLEKFEACLSYFTQVENEYRQSQMLYYLIFLAVDRQELNQAEQYLVRLTEINSSYTNKEVNQQYKVSKALLLKESSRSRNWIKAAEILEDVIKEEVIDYLITVDAMFLLFELLILELKQSADSVVLSEINNLATKLTEIAKDQSSYWLLIETYWLQGELALVNSNVKEARRLFSQAQYIAEEKGLERLAMKISYEHDDLINELTHWEDLIERKASLVERLEAARLDEIVKEIRKQERVIYHEAKEEEPILLLLMLKSGLPAYSKHFGATPQMNEILIAGFISAIDKFAQEAFSVKGSIERFKHEGFTMLYKHIKPISFCYIFKGESYLATKKFDAFIKSTQKSKEVWEILESLVHTGNRDIIDSNDELRLIINQTFRVVNLQN